MEWSFSWNISVFFFSQHLLKLIIGLHIHHSLFNNRKIIDVITLIWAFQDYNPIENCLHKLTILNSNHKPHNLQTRVRRPNIIAVSFVSILFISVQYTLPYRSHDQKQAKSPTTTKLSKLLSTKKQLFVIYINTNDVHTKTLNYPLFKKNLWDRGIMQNVSTS